jgi:hypothetical protein
MKRAGNGSAKTPGHRKPLAVMSSTVRSAIANGSRLLDGLDARSAPARRYRDVQNDIASDLGNDLSAAQLHLVRSVSGLVVLREALDARVLNSEPIDTAQYCRLANTLRRCLATLGLQRVPRDVTPDLSSYLQAQAINGNGHDPDRDEVEP